MVFSSLLVELTAVSVFKAEREMKAKLA